MTRAAVVLGIAILLLSGCTRQAATSPQFAPETRANYAKLRVALGRALAQDARNRGIPWAHPIAFIDWNDDGVVIVLKTKDPTPLGDDCSLATIAFTEANQRLSDHLYRQENDPHYNPQTTPVWPVVVKNANGVVLANFDPNAEVGPKC